MKRLEERADMGFCFEVKLVEFSVFQCIYGSKETYELMHCLEELTKDRQYLSADEEINVSTGISLLFRRTVGTRNKAKQIWHIQIAQA